MTASLMTKWICAIGTTELLEIDCLHGYFDSFGFFLSSLQI
jgi:hypothetical protein